MTARKLAPVHPGEMLREEFMIPLGLSLSELARQLDVPPNRISQLLHGKRALTADTALRLEQFFGWPARTWLHLQAEYDLELSRRKSGRKRIHPHPRLQIHGKVGGQVRSA